jgi:N-acetylmuramoyl-L-alanine amidase
MIREFQSFLDRNQIEHFTAREVLFLGASNSWLKLNTVPDPSLWPNILPALAAADELRRRLGKPIQILSAYRNPAYNRAIGGARNSQHAQFRALDLTAKVPIPELARLAKQIRQEKIFTGGLGTYPGFIHLDSRPTNADWRG